MMMKARNHKNHNIRFNMEKEDERRAWERLHSAEVGRMSRSKNRFVIEAVNSHYERCLAVKDDPYLETREKEDAFAERIVEMVEKKVLSSLPALFGLYVMQMQPSPACPVAPEPVPFGEIQAGTVPSGGMGAIPSLQGAGQQPPAGLGTTVQDGGGEAAELPDNDLIDFDAF